MQGGDKGRPRKVFQFDALDGNLNFCDCSDQHVCQIAICIKKQNEASTPLIELSIAIAPTPF